MSDEPHHLSTQLVQLGRRAEWTEPAVNPPIWRASTHLYENSAAQQAGLKVNADGHFHYGARGGPTQWALADALTVLEPGAAGTMLYPTGLAAAAMALLSVLKAGDEVLVADNCYDPSRTIAVQALRDYGISARFFDPHDVAGFAAAIGDATRAVLLENPGSVSMEVCDIPALTAAAKARGLAVLLDNTWAGPTGFQALKHGVDLSILALTKHVGGHSDLMLGAVTANAACYPRLRRRSLMLGQMASPDDCALALRGLRTMGVRLERSCASALTVAEWLQSRSEIAAVLFPMLPGSPGHELWKRDFTGGCGLMTIIMAGKDAKARDALVDALSLFGIGYSWGGFESLALGSHPERDRDVLPWPPRGIDPENRFAVRLWIGLEEPADLIADLERGLAAWADS
ncbi:MULTISPECIES: cystathionine beta-lyase [unclassified Novosphingobium]|uniref:cystathionine beta-lyase n=1 Tax=unclassified Novosphingobium TaxID=2644732 RepID=UPI000EDAD754|nr:MULTISPECIES: cystathionine beta-lyase [unclassified Novosphingobium]HCF24523.1 cystathionine beta-lyase [Novosphingobium sp.]HQV03337.1 cystathionine beta-lyase [Novosphingobium sp.]